MSMKLESMDRLLLKRLHEISLFRGLAKADAEAFLRRVPACGESYAKGDVLLRAGDESVNIGILLEGALRCLDDGVGGQSYLIRFYEPYDLLEYSAVGTRRGTAPFTVVSSARSRVCWFAWKDVLALSPTLAPFKDQILTNIMSEIADDYIRMARKSVMLSDYHTRDRILKYIETAAELRGSNSVTLTMTQIDLGDYLHMHPTRVSVGMKRLVREGVIKMDGKKITLLKQSQNFFE